MDNNSCVNHEHQYGLWNIDREKKIVWRTCEKCQFTRELPITSEVTMQIKKQEEAARIFKAFQLVKDEDINIINYLEIILEDYINYLNKEDFKTLIKRIKYLEKLDIIDAQNILYLNQLDTYFTLDNLDLNTTIDAFDDTVQLDETSIKIDSYEQS